MKNNIICLFFVFVFGSLSGQVSDLEMLLTDRNQPIKATYKIINTDTLNLILRYPPKFKKSKKYPTIIFFFGGGWNGGRVKQFQPQAEYFASRGMISVLADYRVKSRHSTTPYEAVNDAKSAIRYLRQHAKLLHINPKKIVASGGSAGGHLAAACGNLPRLDEPGEDLSISSKANALVLFNPVFDNGPDGFQNKRMGERWQEISSAHNITKGAPPTIVFLGTKDHLIPVSVAENYNAKMEAVGSRCDLHLYEGQKHGFFNQKKASHEYYNRTVREADLFLTSLKFIKGKPTIGEADDFKKWNESPDWKLKFSDPCTENWRTHWFLDGELATIEHSEKGMNFSAGPINRNDAHHAVLWTKESFEGDIKIEYNYTRTDSQMVNVNILYIQATGIGKDSFDTDISKWNEFRKVPTMSKYYNYMKTIHISYAAFKMVNDDPNADYIRIRQYPVSEEITFDDMEIAPAFYETGLFLTGVTYKMTWIKTKTKLYLKVEGNDLVKEFSWNLNKPESITKGRIGLRHMFTRSANYSDFNVYVKN